MTQTTDDPAIPQQGPVTLFESAAEWTAFVLKDNGGVRDDGHWHAEHCPGAPAFPCHCIVIENEMSDYRMILGHCSAIYDEASGGRVSKPNTLPSVVIDFMEENRQKEIEEAVAEFRSEFDTAFVALESALRAVKAELQAASYPWDWASMHAEEEADAALALAEAVRKGDA